MFPWNRIPKKKPSNQPMRAEIARYQVVYVQQMWWRLADDSDDNANETTLNATPMRKCCCCCCCYVFLIEYAFSTGLCVSLCICVCVCVNECRCGSGLRFPSSIWLSPISWLLAYTPHHYGIVQKELYALLLCHFFLSTFSICAICIIEPHATFLHVLPFFSRFIFFFFWFAKTSVALSLSLLNQNRVYCPLFVA